MIHNQLGRVEFPDRVEKYAHSTHVDDEREIVNATGIPRRVRMQIDGSTEEFVVEPWKHGCTATRDDENTWPVQKDGRIVLVPDGMGDFREDFREFPRSSRIEDIAF